MPNFTWFFNWQRFHEKPNLDKAPEGWVQNKNGPTLFFKTYSALRPSEGTQEEEGPDRISVLLLDILSLEHPPGITIEVEQNLKAREITFKVLGNCASLRKALAITIIIEKLCNDNLQYPHTA